MLYNALKCCQAEPSPQELPSKVNAHHDDRAHTHTQATPTKPIATPRRLLSLSPPAHCGQAVPARNNISAKPRNDPTMQRCNDPKSSTHGATVPARSMQHATVPIARSRDRSRLIMFIIAATLRQPDSPRTMGRLRAVGDLRGKYATPEEPRVRRPASYQPKPSLRRRAPKEMHGSEIEVHGSKCTGMDLNIHAWI